MNFLRRRGRKTTITISDQTRSSRASLSSGEGRNSQLGSTGTLRKTNVIGKDFSDQDYHNSETVLFENHGSVKDLTTPPRKNNSKHAHFSDDTNQNNNSSHAESRHQPQHGTSADKNYLRAQQPRDMTLLAHPSPRLAGDAPDEASGTPMSLYASVINGDKAELKRVISANPELLDTPDNFGRTPLMYCVLADRLDCAKFLIKMRCKLDQVDNAGRSAIHTAAHKGSYKFLELLLHRGASIDIKDHDGQTALHLATRIRSPKCLEFLLRNVGPGMVDVPDNQSRTALHWSAAFNNTECVKLLIKYGINIAIPDADGKTPLHWAANNHDPSAVNTMSALLEKSPGVVNWQDYEGRTALHFAVADGNSAAVELLVKFKPLDYFEPYTCDVDRSDNTFRTALHWAAQLGNAHITKILLDAGAKNSVTDTNGATPFLYAASNNHHSVVEVMIAHDPKVVEQMDIAGRNALMWAAGKGANDVIRIVLGVRRNAQNRNLNNRSESSLEKSGNSGNRDEDSKTNLEFATLDINKADNQVNTALHVAALNGKESSVELLLSQGARHDLQNAMNHTPIFGACEKGHLIVVKYLLDYNASITLVDSESRSPLHWAALGGHAEVCEVLIKEGLNVDIRDTLDRTPLHCAAFGGFINCMNLLLENGANVDLQDQEGRSALHWAAQSGHLDAAKLLFQYAVFPNPMQYTEERLTPLNHALQQEKEEVAQYLMEQGALSAEHISNIAATKVQACFRGYRVRKTFLMRKNTLMRMVELRSKKNRQKKRSEGQMSDDGGRKQDIDCVPGEHDTGHLSDHVRGVAATKIQAWYRGCNVRKTMPIRSRVSKITDNTKNETPQQSESQKSNGVDESRSADEVPDRSLNTVTKGAACTEFHDKAATRIQACVRGYLARKLLAKRKNTSVKTVLKSEDDKCKKQHENISDDSNSLSAKGTADDPPNLEMDPSPHGSGETLITRGPGKTQFEHSSPIALSGASERDAKQESPARNAATNNVLATMLKFDSEDTSTSAQSKPTAKETRKKKPKKRRLKPAANDTSSENDFKDHKTAAKTSPSSSPISLKSIASSKGDNSVAKPKKLTPTPPSAAKKEDRKNRRRLLSHTPAESLRQHSYPTLDIIGNEDNIHGESVSGLAYKPQPQEQLFFDDLPLPIAPAPKVIVSPSLELSEYVESLMKLSSEEKRLLSEHQQSRRDAFKAAINAAITIQRAWWRFLAAKKPDLRKNFRMLRKRAQRLERRRKNQAPTIQLPHAGDKKPGSVLSGSVDGGPMKVKPNQRRRLLPDITSNSTTSVYNEKSPRSDTSRSSLASYSDVRSSSSSGGTKGRRPRTVGPRHNSVYISVEKLEELSRIYGNPQVMHDLMTASSKPSLFPSFDRAFRSSGTKVRPVTVSDKRSPYSTSVAPSAANRSSPVSSKSPRRWVSGMSKPRQESVMNGRRPLKSDQTSQSAPSGTLSPQSVESEIDVSRLPLQWQRLYGELQSVETADVRRRQFARFSYNIGDMGY